MELFEINGSILPSVTLFNRDFSEHKRKNINRTSNEYIFYFVCDGELYVSEDNIEYKLKKGDTFLFEPGRHHLGVKDSIYNFYYLHFNHPDVRKVQIDDDKWAGNAADEHRKWLASVENDFSLGNRITIPKRMSFTDEAVIYSIKSLFEHAIEQRRQRAENHNVLASLSAYEIFIECYRKHVLNVIKWEKTNKAGAGRVNEVLEFLKNNYNRKITGNDIEKSLSYNFDYLNQVFKKYLGKTIFAMLYDIRMENAKELLSSSDLPLNIIAQRVGFEDASYFSKAFKRYTGYSPKYYRKQTEQ